MIPFGAYSTPWRTPSGQLKDEAGRWALSSTGSLLVFVANGFLMRSFLLYTSQVEHLRTVAGPEVLHSRRLLYQGAMHAAIKVAREHGTNSLFRGTSTLALLAPLSCAATATMSYWAWDIGKSATVLEDVKKALLGIGAIVAFEYAITPLRTLYLQQATSLPGNNYIATKDFVWRNWRQYRPGLHTFVLSSVLYSMTYIHSALWHSYVTRTDPFMGVQETQDGRPLYDESSKQGAIRHASTLPWLAASNFVLLVGLRQMINASPDIKPSLKYSSSLQAWRYQLRVGPRALLLGCLSAIAFVLPPGPYIWVAEAWVSWNYGVIKGRPPPPLEP